MKLQSPTYVQHAIRCHIHDLEDPDIAYKPLKFHVNLLKTENYPNETLQMKKQRIPARCFDIVWS
jgi:hypothetical protein